MVKLVASDARYTAVETSSSGRPNRRIGVRAINSWPRGESSRALFRAVGKTPGAMALTNTL